MTESLVLERDYPVPPERLFTAWVDVGLLSRWFGCGPGMVWNVHEWDARTGGAIHVSLEFEQGPFEVRGEFLVVEPPSRLRYRWSGEQVVDVTIEARGSGSHLRLEHSGLVTDQECSVTQAGWGHAIEQLRTVFMSKKLIHWFDIPVLDIERAGKFYSTILDVELKHLEAPPDIVMKWFPADEPHGGGGLIQGGGRTPSSDGSVVYFNGGNDLDAVLRRVEPAGGTVTMGKTGDAESGYVAFFVDTEGNKVGLHSTG